MTGVHGGHRHVSPDAPAFLHSIISRERQRNSAARLVCTRRDGALRPLASGEEESPGRAGTRMLPISRNSILKRARSTAADGPGRFNINCSSRCIFRLRTKRYPAIVDVYGGPGVRGCLNNWHGQFSFTDRSSPGGGLRGLLISRSTNRGQGVQLEARHSQFTHPPAKWRICRGHGDQVQGARWLGSQEFRGSQAPFGVWGWKLMAATHDASI